MAKKKAPNRIDVYVGSRVRLRRLQLQMSQEDLGDLLEITYQQIQKYEAGRNRIGASRLHAIAKILEVPVSFFFEGSPGSAGGSTMPQTHMDVLATQDGVAMIAVLVALAPQIRRKYIQVGRLLAGLEDERPSAEVIKLDPSRASMRPKRRAAG